MKSKMIIFSFMLIIMACSSKKESNSKLMDGKLLFRNNCVLCHGIDGKLQVNGSKDLSLSNLSKAERIIRVAKGKGVMQAFENILSEKEIEAVVTFTLNLE